MTIEVAIAQMEIWDGDKERNLNNALKILKSLSNSEKLPDIVCFPELFTTGYDLKNSQEHAEIFPGYTIKQIIEISQNKFVVLGTILEVENGKFYNTAFLIGKNGSLIGKYRKVHLFKPMREDDFLTPGNEISIFSLADFNNFKIGIAICYDLRFPELFRLMALKGAQIIFLPSEFPNPKRKIWKTLIRARAIENQIYVIGINRVGKGKNNDFFGCSIVSNGETLEQLSDKPEIKVFSIDLDKLNSIREKIHALKDRRTELY